MNSIMGYRYPELLKLASVVVFGLLVSACSSSTPKVIKVDESRVKVFAQNGYDSGIEYETVVARFLVKSGNDFNQVVSVQPKREGKYPLVIYMPGLGESSEAGNDMRNAWARSGYVVLTIQPLKEDEDVWSSEAAHRAEFSDIRHERYSAAVISSRLTVISDLLEHVRQGSLSGDKNLQNIDLSQIAIVGFDVGASSAMIVAGEDFPNVYRAGLSVLPNVVIALSPHSYVYGADFDQRYQKINIPALSVTGDKDDDTHGNDPVSLHQVPFQHMPPGNKYLLLLPSASHSLIGGGAVGNDIQAAGDGAGKQIDSDNPVRKSGPGRGGRNGKKGAGKGADEGYAARGEAERSPTQRAKVKVAIQQVTTAFLNAYIKKDRFAIEWLKNDAQTWLYGVGQLQER